jgi:hypothetical protein
LVNIDNFTTGYIPVVLALLLVVTYFNVLALLMRVTGSRQVSVARYEPPTGASPAVAAWLIESGKLPRAMAAALVNMAAKGYLKIEQSQDLVWVTQLATETSMPLRPEERVLAQSLFRGYDNFDFAQATPQLAKAIKTFECALLNTEYFSAHTELSIPAWAVSGLATLFALSQGHYFANGSIRVLEAVVLLTCGCFVVAVRTLSGTVEKIACHFPGSTAPRRSWTGADTTWNAVYNYCCVVRRCISGCQRSFLLYATGPDFGGQGNPRATQRL